MFVFPSLRSECFFFLSASWYSLLFFVRIFSFLFFLGYVSSLVISLFRSPMYLPFSPLLPSILSPSCTLSLPSLRSAFFNPLPSHFLPSFIHNLLHFYLLPFILSYISSFLPLFISFPSLFPSFLPIRPLFLPSSPLYLSKFHLSFPSLSSPFIHSFPFLFLFFLPSPLSY